MNQLHYFLLLIVIISCSNSDKTEETYKVERTAVNVELSSLDSAKLANFWLMAEQNNLAEKSIPGIHSAVADWLMGTPYVGGTLDINEEEKLVVNLQALDCVTFLENIIVLSQCVKSNAFSNEAYFEKLQSIRYRNKKIKGYSSRLHYFTEWLIHNNDRGLITIVSNDFGDAAFNSEVNFMSQNPQYYKPLSDSLTLSEIVKAEERISVVKLKMVSKDYLENVEHLIKDGDIIAVATTIDGIGIAHTGMAKHHNGRLHMIHASSVKKKVVLSEKTLSDYLKGIKTDSGVLIARVN